MTHQWACSAVVVALVAVTCVTAAANESGSLPYRRGIAISHSMGWAEVQRGKFVYPAFISSERHLKPAELTSLRDAGFDFVRLAVDPGPFLQAGPAHLSQLERTLIERVSLILRSDLSVVVDLHPSDLHPDFLDRRLAADVNSVEFQSYLRLLDRLARLLDQFKSRRVSLELMNEPPVSGRKWASMLDAAYRTVRKRAPNLLIVLSDGLVHLNEGLRTLAPYTHDHSVFYSFHYYDPLEFTHQGASWTEMRYLTDVSYPATARPVSDALSATARAIAAATSLTPEQRLAAMRNSERLLYRYKHRSFDRTAISRYFEIAFNWARANRLAPSRIFLGEFGVRSPGHVAAAPDRASEADQWLLDVREEAERRSFTWAVWTYKGSGGFSLSENGSSPKLRIGARIALGLTPK